MIGKQRIVRWIWPTTFFILIIYGLHCHGGSKTQAPDAEKRPDRIAINTTSPYGEPERPPVWFSHELHNRALGGENESCASCHLKDNDFLSPNFKRPRQWDPSQWTKNEVVEIYHSNCMGCHKQTRDKNEKSGPVTCGNCHVKFPGPKTVFDPMGFDQSLHYRHVKANANKCDTCHHVYDATAQKLVYGKGQEASCRYCHKTEDEENRIRFQKAAHLSCIACHRLKTEAGVTSGPSDCRGCHDPVKKQSIKEIEPVPRMERNQPDTLFVKRFHGDENAQPGPDDPFPARASDFRMPLVPFNHKGHETDNKTCRVCHHAAMTPCAGCHTLTGLDVENAVGLEQAMHRKNTETSCIGCHDMQKDQPACRGCHGRMTQVRPKNPEYCNTCHMARVTDNEPLESFINDGEKAAKLLEKHQAPTVDAADSDIPEFVTIGVLSRKYEPTILPHRKIIHTLSSDMKDNRLAGAFHRGALSTCGGCHHNSPQSLVPPRCGSCHGIPFDSEKIHMPGLKGAYHQQCMGCHEAMALDKPKSTKCYDCHEKKGDRKK